MAIKCVSLVHCEDYDRQRVYESVKRSIDLLGGIEKFVSAGWKVLLKPNLLQPEKPEKHITTHTEMIYAVARILRDADCEVTIADSPGTPPYSERMLRRLYQVSGLDIMAREMGVELNLDTGYEEISAPEAKLIKRFSIISPASKADAVIVVSKAKTHLQTGLTGAAKNLFGLIPGLHKSAFHARLSRIEDFSNMIIDLNELIKPKLQIMDAIIGMEGNGPSAGHPRKIGAVLASPDYNAIDLVTSGLMSFKPFEVSTINAAVSRGLIKADFSEIKILGEDMDDFIVSDFKHPSTQASLIDGHLRGLIDFLIKPYSLMPQVAESRCTGCQRCRKVCPKDAITMIEDKAKIRQKDCIGCYCCHEMCPSQAIDLKRCILGRAIAAMINVISNELPN